MTDWLLPYPMQLPQDYYNKNLPLPVTSVPETVVPPTLDTTPPPSTSIAINNGGIYYGDLPPGAPQYGWLWTNRKGALYVYMEPGVWSQIATNW
jgi:hypothetical protein